MSEPNYGKVLAVDDDADVLGVFRKFLEREGYRVTTAQDPSTALELVESVKPEVIILDVLMPKIDGLTLCREIRARSRAPIMIVSGLSEDIDRIIGLEVGADDYLAKPFNPKEMVARVRALFRRLQLDGVPAAAAAPTGGLQLEPAAFRAHLEGRELALTRTEFLLLQALMQASGRVLTRQQLLDEAWGADYYGDERIVDSHIRNLRRKLEAASPNFSLITAVRGVGYRFEG